MFFLKRIYFLVIFSTLIACQKNEETPLINIGNGFTLTEGEYSVTLKWKFNSDKRIQKVQIFRGTNKENLELYATINPSSNSEYVDKTAGVRTEFFYKINYLLTDKSESNFSQILSKVPKEPINMDSPKNGENGGIHYAYWRFNSPTFNRIRHKFTIHDEPSNGDGLYYQFYQGILNDTIGFYYGIQTHVTNPTGNHKKGLIFSRWGTRDPNNYKTATGGWGESAGYEGDFIGIRKNYEWTIGEYETDLKKDSSDVKGDWYSLHIRKLPNESPVYIGSIRFEKSSKSSGIKTDGITWTELYWKKTQTTPLPSWHVSINDVTVNESEKPKQVYATYSSTKFINFTNIFTTNNADVHFLMGPKVKKFHSEGNLWFR